MKPHDLVGSNAIGSNARSLRHPTAAPRDAAAASLRAVLAAEKKKNRTDRRKQIDPTTCERDYSADELEFMRAMDDYKRKHGRMFPTCSEILEVVRSLGYAKAPSTAHTALAAVEELSLAIERALD
ncbi:MAG: hypothetical protein ACK5OB_03300 [Pirellula sp.]